MREFTQLIQWDTICSDYLLTRTTYSSTVAIPEAVIATGNGAKQQENRDDALLA